MLLFDISNEYKLCTNSDYFARKPKSGYLQWKSKIIYIFFKKLPQW